MLGLDDDDLRDDLRGLPLERMIRPSLVDVIEELDKVRCIPCDPRNDGVLAVLGNWGRGDSERVGVLAPLPVLGNATDVGGAERGEGALI
jgi:hypothetical protein